MATFVNFIEGWDIAKAELVKAWLIENIDPQTIKTPGYEHVGEGWRLEATTQKLYERDGYVALQHFASPWTLHIDNDALAIQFKLTFM
jgi:glutamine cyclotransferase